MLRININFFDFDYGQNCKKYSHKYVLKENDLLLIPPNWYYIQEIDKEITNDLNIQYHID